MAFATTPVLCFPMFETFLCLLLQPNCLSPLPSPTGFPPSSSLHSKHHPKPDSPLRNIGSHGESEKGISSSSPDSTLSPFSFPHLRTDKWLFLQMLPLRGCDEIQHLCHFQFSFDDLALHGTACASPMLSSLLQPRHFFSSDHSMSYDLFSTHPSTTSFLITLRYLSVDGSLVFLRHKAWAPARLLLSTPHTRSSLPISFNRLSLLVSDASSFTPCGQTTLMSTATCPSTNKVPLWRLDYQDPQSHT